MAPPNPDKPKNDMLIADDDMLIKDYLRLMDRDAKKEKMDPVG